MNADPIFNSSAESIGAGSTCPARRSIGFSRANVTAAMNASATPFMWIVGGVDGIGDRAEEPLRLPANERLDQIVTPGVAAVGRHP